MLKPMGEDIPALFGRAGCTGQLCVLSLDGTQQVTVDADRPAVPASVIKILVALEAETQFAAGQLNPRERVTLRAAERTPGPVLFSLFQDDVRASLRDLVVAMLTISDNVATDALLDRIGLDAVNTRAAHLGLAGTVVTANLRTIINSIGRDAGFADWDAMWEWAAQPLSDADEQALVSRIAAAAALDPARTTRTTARDMATLLRLIWSDQAGPAAACQRVRQLMRRQLTRHRLAAAFPAPAVVAAKSGSLVGVVRNEAGVIEYPGGRGYAATVFAQTRRPWQDDAAINEAIGTAAAAAVGRLRAQEQTR
jgi:beta-lactamase class A